MTTDDACVPNIRSEAGAGHSHVEISFSRPPLTPGTNLKVGEALRASYSGWNDKTRQRSIPRDPRLWENIEER